MGRVYEKTHGDRLHPLRALSLVWGECKGGLVGGECTAEAEEEGGRREEEGGGRKEGAEVANKNKNPTLRMWGKTPYFS